MNRMRLTPCLIIIFFGLNLNLNAQNADCLEGYQVSLNFYGERYLRAEELNKESSDYQFLKVEPSYFTCEDIGRQEVTLTAVDRDGNSSSCTTMILIVDDTPPSLKTGLGLPRIMLEFNDDGEVELPDVDLGEYFYDACSEITTSLQDIKITCRYQPHTINVIARDLYGNEKIYGFSTQYDLDTREDQNLFCREDYDYEADFAIDQIRIDNGDVIDASRYTCNLPRVDIELTDTDGNIVTSIKEEYIGEVITARVSMDNDPSINCTVNLTIREKSCTGRLIVCDTECRDAPVGDCESGHSLEDDVEWPCDLVVDGCTDYKNLEPETLLEILGLEEEDVFPELKYDCILIHVDYYDDIKELTDQGFIINRNWRVIDWNFGNQFSYTQEIELIGKDFTFCDTKSWDTDLGDCASGHTDQDAIEWPADITVLDGSFELEALRLRGVDKRSVMPQFESDCVDYSLDFKDINTDTGDGFQVIRTWSVLFEGQELITYDQIITLERSDITQQIVCAETINGDAISGVLVNGVPDLNDGCASLNLTAGDRLSLSKIDNPKMGIDNKDRVMLVNHLYYDSQLSDLQLLAADLDQNGRVNSEDLNMMEDILAGKLTLESDRYWIFLFADNLESEVITIPLNRKRANRFIGIKLGDLNGDGNKPVKSELKTMPLIYENKMLESGEVYSVDFYLPHVQVVRGLGFEMKIDETKASYISFEKGSMLEDHGNDHNFADAELKVAVINYGTNRDDYIRENQTIVFPSEPIFSITIQAQTSTEIRDIIAFDETWDNHLIENEDYHYYEMILTPKTEEGFILSTDNLDGFEFSVFPNPAQDFLKIKGLNSYDQDVRYSVYSVDGQQLVKGELKSDQISVNGLPSGVYLLMIEDQNGVLLSEKVEIIR